MAGCVAVISRGKQKKKENPEYYRKIGREYQRDYQRKWRQQLRDVGLSEYRIRKARAQAKGRV